MLLLKASSVPLFALRWGSLKRGSSELKELIKRSTSNMCSGARYSLPLQRSNYFPPHTIPLLPPPPKLLTGAPVVSSLPAILTLSITAFTGLHSECYGVSNETPHLQKMGLHLRPGLFSLVSGRGPKLNERRGVVWRAARDRGRKREGKRRGG